ncbi:MAG: L,D-transpeptidase [Patescibacteria group bacterium]|jgi:lipoprotein-anchoring transpeptidase ErfK/SrfK
MKAFITRFLVLFLIFGTGLIFTKDSWPLMFSKQDPIDPEYLTENYDPSKTLGIFDNREVSVPPQNLSKILGEHTGETTQKRIEVDLTTQMLSAYENNKLVYNFLISTGKWDRTPTGTFKIWAKILSQKMSGGSKELGTYYYLPNVPYILFFYNDKVPKHVGYSIHGTYWHNNFGVPMSHGCVNMKTPEAEMIFNWADYDTPITIFGKYQTQLPSVYMNPNQSTLLSSTRLPIF